MHFIRPDAARAFDDEGVKKALGRYVEVSTNRKSAKFLICKAVPVSAVLGSNEKKLWEEHEQGVEEFRRLEEKLDAARMPENLKPQKISLLDLKLELANRILSSCNFCERRCGADRAKGKRGFCNLDKTSRLSSEFLHFGEEACLVLSHTFFFVGCTFYCEFCQNWTISRQIEAGVPVTGKQLAEIAKRRRIEGSRNINLVGGEPTPNLHTILEMLLFLDVNVPIVWNSNMYMSSEAMKLLDGCVDIYLADFKYGNDKCAERLSRVKNYWEIAARNHLLAREQAELLIRHLVLPNHVECCTKRVLRWIAKNFNNDVRVNIMSQYRPEFNAYRIPDISRPVTGEEMRKAFQTAKQVKLTNLD